MFEIVRVAWAGTSVLPIVTILTLIVGTLQAAGGSFIAIKCCWLGITWRRGTEHGMDEFSALGVSAAFIAGATAFGAAVAGAAGSPLVPGATLEPLNAAVGDVVGALWYLALILTPGLSLRRAWTSYWEHHHATD